MTEKLTELMEEPCDEVFPEYITVMVSNGKTIRCGNLFHTLAESSSGTLGRFTGEAFFSSIFSGRPNRSLMVVGLVRF